MTLEQRNLTEPSLLDLLGHESEDRQQLDHDLDNDTSHCGGGWDLNVYFKAMEEMFHALEEIDDGTITRTDILSHLCDPRNWEEMIKDNEGSTYGDKNTDTGKD